MIHSEDRFVRAAIAELGYGLDLLINDDDWLVRKAAESKLEEIRVDNDVDLGYN
ncbi:MAG: hypothetical protein HOK52_14735 [Candidatus Marinimicrobia bacterium]|jgi:hypothetical protein|nr:hypothetical protein [Candidatus Neomarinimicrobiota bacterium]